MRLICTDENCDHVYNDYEAGGPYQAPTCPRCDSPMRPFNEPVVEFYSTDAGRDLMFAMPDTAPAEQYAMPAGSLFRRQAGGR